MSDIARKFLCTAVICLSVIGSLAVSGCGSVPFYNGNRDRLPPGSTPEIQLRTPVEAPPVARSVPAPAKGRNLPPSGYNDVVDLTNRSGDPSVQVYSLDTPTEGNGKGAAPGTPSFFNAAAAPEKLRRVLGPEISLVPMPEYDHSAGASTRSTYSPRKSAPLQNRISGIPYTGDASVTVFPVGMDEPSSPYKTGAARYPLELGPDMRLYPVEPERVQRFALKEPESVRRNLGDKGFLSGGAVSVFFEHGSAVLDSEDKLKIADVSDFVETHPLRRLLLEGYASARAETDDPVKRKVLNLKQSMKRVISVSNELIAQGVPAESIDMVAYGDTRPAPDFIGIDPESASRRVDILTAP